MAVIDGKCVNASGAPVPGVYVYAWPVDDPRPSRRASTHTRPDGVWRLDLSPGQWMIRETGHEAHQVMVGSAPITTKAPAPEQRTPKTDDSSVADDMKRRMEQRRARRADREG